MAESTLSLGFSDIQKEIAYVLGYTRTQASWTSDQDEEITRAIDDGYRNFFHAYDWKFKKIISAFHLWADVAESDDVDVTGIYDTTTYSVVTATEDTFYDSMVGESIVITDVGTFVIYSYTSATVIVVVGDATAVAKTFSIASEGTFNLPDDYGGFEGKWTFQPNETQFPITVVGEGQIRGLHQRGVTSERPRVIGIRPKSFDPKVSQRWELITYPNTDGHYELGYNKLVQPGKLTVTNQYPVGGVAHCQTVLAFCMAAAEILKDGGPPPLTKKGATTGFALLAKEALARSIQIDSEANAPDSLGYNGDPSGYGRGHFNMGTDHTTYDGTIYGG